MFKKIFSTLTSQELFITIVLSVQINLGIIHIFTIWSPCHKNVITLQLFSSILCLLYGLRIFYYKQFSAFFVGYYLLITL